MNVEIGLIHRQNGVEVSVKASSEAEAKDIFERLVAHYQSFGGYLNRKAQEQTYDELLQDQLRKLRAENRRLKKNL